MEMFSMCSSCRSEWCQDCECVREELTAQIKVLQEQVATLLAGPSAPAWQPIATAPKDGTNFLAASFASSVFMAHWANGVVDSCLYDNDWGYFSRFASQWMPLPTAPPQEPTDMRACGLEET